MNNMVHYKDMITNKINFFNYVGREEATRIIREKASKICKEKFNDNPIQMLSNFELSVIAKGNTEDEYFVRFLFNNEDIETLVYWEVMYYGKKTN